MNATLTNLSRRRLLGGLAAAGSSLLLVGRAAAASLDLSGVTLRIGVYRGQDQTRYLAPDCSTRRIGPSSPSSRPAT